MPHPTEVTPLATILAEAKRQREAIITAMTPEDHARERRLDRAFQTAERVTNFWLDFDEREMPR